MTKSSKQIRAEIEALQAEYNLARNMEVKAAREEIMAIMQTYGLRIEDLSRPNASKQTPRTPTPLEPVFSDGQGNNWSGRGRMPRWLEGKDRENYRIKKEEVAA